MTTIQHPAPMPATPGQRAHLTDAQLATLLQGWGVSMVTDQVAVDRLIHAACHMAAVPQARAGVHAQVVFASYQRHILTACLDHLPAHHYATLARVAAQAQPTHVYAFLGEHIPHLQAIVLRATAAYLWQVTSGTGCPVDLIIAE